MTPSTPGQLPDVTNTLQDNSRILVINSGKTSGKLRVITNKLQYNSPLLLINSKRLFVKSGILQENPAIQYTGGQLPLLKIVRETQGYSRT
jgi:hypothetical protein